MKFLVRAQAIGLQCFLIPGTIRGLLRRKSFAGSSPAMSGLPLSGYVWGRIVLGDTNNLKGWKVHFLSRPRGAPRPPPKHPERPPGPVQGLVFAF